MRWQTTLVAGRSAHYGVGGDGPPVLFLHGWGIADRAFEKALETLTAAGLRVYAPALPGFGVPRNFPVPSTTWPATPAGSPRSSGAWGRPSR